MDCIRLEATGPESGRSMTDLPNALESMPRIISHLEGRKPALFFDYDGTLTPIVDDPEKAVMDHTMRSILETVSERWPTAIVSGRDLQVL